MWSGKRKKYVGRGRRPLDPVSRILKCNINIRTIKKMCVGGLPFGCFDGWEYGDQESVPLFMNGSMTCMSTRKHEPQTKQNKWEVRGKNLCTMNKKMCDPNFCKREKTNFEFRNICFIGLWVINFWTLSGIAIQTLSLSWSWYRP